MPSVDNDGIVTLAVPVTEETAVIADAEDKDGAVKLAPALPKALPMDAEEIKPVIAPVVESPVTDSEPTCASEIKLSTLRDTDNLRDIFPN